MHKATYSYARQHLSAILESISNGSETFCITRRNGQEIIMLDKSDYNSLVETAYLLRSPKNARILAQALDEAQHNIGTKIDF